MATLPIVTKMVTSHMTAPGKMAEASAPAVFLVSGIPRKFRSADLRHYFSQFTESDGFVCFHYRHRPELRGSAAESCATFCCPVIARPHRADSFMAMYHGKPWLDPGGNQVPGRCLIHRVRDTPGEDPLVFPYKTRRELLAARCSVDGEKRVTSAELLSMSELNPPALMPQGNVGTPMSVFMQLIRTCRLPPKLITLLGLKFRRSRRRYSSVPYVYACAEISGKEEGVYTANGHQISEEDTIGSSVLESDTPKQEDEEQSHSEDDNDTCEEWERHEALHEDITSQERSKERLYEEKIELKWEKGGSGLVFYTDAQLWQEQEGDFDEQTADDWDVDMSEYYDPGTGDKDAKDFLKMRLETRRREGLATDGETRDLGGFERYTKGVGRKLMERQGWTDGAGLGSSGAGMPEALENEGQHPKCKYGFGYHGEKLSTLCPKQKKPRYYISTVYDEPREEDKGATLLRRMPSTSLKRHNYNTTSLKVERK